MKYLVVRIIMKEILLSLRVKIILVGYGQIEMINKEAVDIFMIVRIKKHSSIVYNIILS
jgi:hypothetical protein